MSGVPYIIEESGNGERVYDLYSRLLKDRIVFIGEEFTSSLANSVVAQLLFLESDNNEKDITVYVNSPGGQVSACLSIYDAMNYVKPDVSTICVGQAASAAAFVLSAGTKGKRFALKNSRIMMHQISGGAVGHIEDMKRTMDEVNKLNFILLTELSKTTGKTMNKLKKDLERDYYISPEEAKKYGVIDEVLYSRE